MGRLPGLASEAVVTVHPWPMSSGQQLWTAYNHALIRRPLLVKCLTGLLGTLLGDLLAQVFEYALASQRQPDWPGMLVSISNSMRRGPLEPASSQGLTKKPAWNYDARRCWNLCLYSTLVGTPIAHYWYLVLDELIFPANPTATIAVASKLALDQLFMAPLGLALFFYVLKVIEGRREHAWQTAKSKLWPTLTANYAVWPLANFINFKYVPAEQRILYVNIISLIWTVYISYTANESTSAPRHKHTA